MLKPKFGGSEFECPYFLNYLKVLSCELYNNKYMIASTKITNTVLRKSVH